MTTVTSKGQITIPKPVRDTLGLKAGSQVSFEVQPGHVVLRKEVPAEVLNRWRGYVRDRVGARSTDDVMHELRDE